MFRSIEHLLIAATYQATSDVGSNPTGVLIWPFLVFLVLSIFIWRKNGLEGVKTHLAKTLGLEFVAVCFVGICFYCLAFAQVIYIDHNSQLAEINKLNSSIYGKDGYLNQIKILNEQIVAIQKDATLLPGQTIPCAIKIGQTKDSKINNNNFFGLPNAICVDKSSNTEINGNSVNH